MFAGRPPFAFLRWFQLFCFFHLVSAVCLPDYRQRFFVCPQLLWFGLSFIWCQLFACLIRAAIFSFATNICGLVFLSLPQAFVVCSYFFFFFFFFVTVICVQFLSYTAFSAVGFRARLSVFDDDDELMHNVLTCHLTY